MRACVFVCASVCLCDCVRGVRLQEATTARGGSSSSSSSKQASPSITVSIVSGRKTKRTAHWQQNYQQPRRGSPRNLPPSCPPNKTLAGSSCSSKRGVHPRTQKFSGRRPRLIGSGSSNSSSRGGSSVGCSSILTWRTDGASRLPS